MIPAIKQNPAIRFKFIRSKLFHRILIGLSCFFITLLIVIGGAAPEKFDLKIDDISPMDVIAPRDIVDKYTTDRLKLEAENKITPQYHVDQTETIRVQQKVTDFFTNLWDVRKLTDLNNDEKVAKLKEKEYLLLTDGQLSTCITVKDNDLSQLQMNVVNILRQVMDSGIGQDNLEQVKNNIQDIFQKLENTRDLRELAYSIAANVIQPNRVLDTEETQRLKEKARDDVDARVYKKGEKIVGKGERLKPEHISMLNELGLVKDQKNVDYRFFVGIFFAVLLSFAVIIAYLHYFNSKLLEDRSDLILLSLIILFVLLLTMAFAPVLSNIRGFSLYLMPVAVAPMLITILLDTRLAIVVNLVLSILVGVIMKGDVNFVFVTLISGTFAALTVNKVQQRNKLTLAGIILSAINALLIISFGLFENNDIKDVFYQGTHGIVNGVMSIVITIGILPFLEATFNIITPLKLLELSNPNQPLIKRLLMEAPGTYHHSLMVGNLAEAATEAIGGNALLARVAAYYHDIGKLKRPYFFKENQFNDNPHDRMTANLSTLVITSHTKDGEEIAKANKIPLVIRNIIREHHGTTLVAFFYHKAINNDKLQSVKPEDFRYEGPKPQSKEAAVVMLADCVEAVVRSITEPTEGKIEGTVRKIIKEKLEDGQLDLCDLTLKDLDIIARAFLRVLSGFFHERIQYPEINLKDEKMMVECKQDNGGNTNEEQGGIDH